MGKFKNEKLNISKLKASAVRIAIPALIIFNLAIFSFLIFKGTGLAWTWGKEKITLSVRNEQGEHEDNLLKLVASIENQTDLLDAEFNDISSKNAIGLEKKKEVLEKLEELEKDGLRFADAFSAYHQDESIKINPLRDFSVDEAFNKSWLLPHKIERLARSFEFGIFKGFITDEQGTIIEKDFSGIRYQIDEIKKNWK